MKTSPKTSFLVDFPHPSPVSSTWVDTLEEAKELALQFPTESATIFAHVPIYTANGDGLTATPQITEPKEN